MGSKKSRLVMGACALGLVVACVVAWVMVIRALPTAQPSAEAQPVAAVVPIASADNAPAAQAPTKKPPVARPQAKKAPVTPAQAKETVPSTSPVAPALPARTVTADVAVAHARVPESAAVTITGCLERDDETFRLKDTSGADAPKARSWRSGFLRKRSASIEVVDAANRVRLPNHVGQRVKVTGMLVDREMQVRSLQRVAASCR